VRDNCFLAEELISSKNYFASLKPMQNLLMIDAEYVFSSKIKRLEPNKKIIFGTEYYYFAQINGKDISIAFDSENFEYYKYIILSVSVPKNCKAPSLFEGLHHALQYCLPSNIESYSELHKKNTENFEACAYYWRINAFPEDKKYKDSIIKPLNIEWIIGKKPEEIILLEKEIIY
jgi:hypothetical protein